MASLGHDLQGIEAVYLDLDGTLYLGGNLIPGAIEFLDRCERRGIRTTFLSNNSSRSVEEYIEKLSQMGIRATSDEILLSTHDLIAWMTMSGIREVHLMGSPGMHGMLREAGIDPVSNDPSHVVLGYHTSLTYADLAGVSFHLNRGVPLIAAHGDLNCPTPDGGVPDVGSFLAMFNAANDVEPVQVCGKPDPGMLLRHMAEHELRPRSCAMIGDRLYTDMQMAIDAAVASVLVLSGEATQADLDASGMEVDLVVNSVDMLLR